MKKTNVLVLWIFIASVLCAESQRDLKLFLYSKDISTHEKILTELYTAFEDDGEEAFEATAKKRAELWKKVQRFYKDKALKSINDEYELIDITSIDDEDEILEALELALEYVKALNHEVTKLKKASEDLIRQPVKDYHAALTNENEYVSATQCKTCHPSHYEEWSRSQHAYAQLSPVYMAMQNAINLKTNGTNGDFCIRCHNQVGMNKEEPTYMANEFRHPASKEGISCIVCHRMAPNKEGTDHLAYGKVSGRIALMKGDLNDKVFGPHRTGEGETRESIDGIVERTYDKHKGKKIVDGQEVDKKVIHRSLAKSAQINTSAFCATCHDVNLFNGFRLEEAFSEYKSSHAAMEGISCQDCHMGVEQGKVQLDANGKVKKSNYRMGLIAKQSVKKKKMTNHTFAGPDYSVIHPGLFPISSENIALAKDSDWYNFKFEDGWGSPIWEQNFADSKIADQLFKDHHGKPNRWSIKEDRMKARERILDQFDRLAEARRTRLDVLKEGYKLAPANENKDVLKITQAKAQEGIKFEVGVKNGTNGHNVPTGFIAERMVWLEVNVYKKNKDGSEEVVFQSGDLDPNGDLRDSHSFFVHNGDKRWQIADGKGAQRLLVEPDKDIPTDKQKKVELDDQLFSLQSKFITRNIRGGEREQVLTVNHSVDTLPFIRPSTTSTVLTGQPAGARIHRLSIPPNSIRNLEYIVEKDLVKEPGIYRVETNLKAAMVPVNLVLTIQEAGFDYNMSPKDVARRLVFGFQQELDSIRYFSFNNKAEREKIVKRYQEQARKTLTTELAVVSEAKAKQLIAVRAVRLYAEDIQRKRVKKIFDLAQKLGFDQAKGYVDIQANVLRRPLEDFATLKSYFIKSYFDNSTYLALYEPEFFKKQSLETQQLLYLLNTKKSAKWRELLDDFSEAESAVKRGLLLEKVAGHDAVQSAELSFEVN